MLNTIEEALAWLQKATGETWTPRELLARILWAGHARRTRSGRFGLPIKAAPPIDTKFGAYRLDRENGTPANPFVRQFGMPWQTVPLWPLQIEQLFHCGETTACVAEEPEDDYGQPGRYILVEPQNEPVRINLSMVRIPDAVLGVLATVTDASSEDEQPGIVEAVSSMSNPDPLTGPPVSVRISLPDAVAGGAANDGLPVSNGAALTPAEAPLPASLVHRVRPGRRNILSPVIDRAVESVGSRDVQAVFPELREMALRQEKPFTGEIVGDALSYTDSKNRNARLTKEALSKRLNRDTD